MAGMIAAADHIAARSYESGCWMVISLYVDCSS
jgi:hypothetical protein